MEKQIDRKEAIRAYKEAPRPAGVFQIKNLVSGKVYLGSSLNLNGPINRAKFELKNRMNRIEQLQKDYDELGDEKFSFDILEVVTPKDDPDFNLEDELTLLEEIWIEKLQPFGEKGYNIDRKIRQA
jgi:group I intron endonuclease